MWCQYIGENGVQCFKQATRDIRVKAGNIGWRLFLCEDHVIEETQRIRARVDQLALEKVKKG